MTHGVATVHACPTVAKSVVTAVVGAGAVRVIVTEFEADDTRLGVRAEPDVLRGVRTMENCGVTRFALGAFVGGGGWGFDGVLPPPPPQAARASTAAMDRNLRIWAFAP
jgi:hypothetical protein